MKDRFFWRWDQYTGILYSKLDGIVSHLLALSIPQCADRPVSDPDAFTKQILPYALRVVATRRNCLDVTEAGGNVGACREGVR